MNNIIDSELYLLLGRINDYYAKLCSLTNDSLRIILKEIEQSICSQNSKKEALDIYLVEVFAIVKETARRFANGDIEVTPTEYDIQLAKKYDFVDIVDNKAIYHCSWNVFGEITQWSMVHYDEQILGGILLHKGYAAEIATGEGKTLIATLPVFINALAHEGVHLMTVNNYLSRRDYELTRPIYMFHGLSVGCIEECALFNQERKAAYQSDITFGTNSSFAFDYLYDHLVMDKDLIVQGSHNFALIDELDSILIDEANNPHIICDGFGIDETKEYQEKKAVVEELFYSGKERLYHVDKLMCTASYTEEGKKWLSAKCGIQDLYAQEIKYSFKQFVNSKLEDYSKDSKIQIIQNVLQQLLNAYTLYERDVNYIIKDGNVFIVDEQTGRLKKNSRWEYGLHAAVEAKEGVKIHPNVESHAVISLKNYFKLYKKIAGMSGTLMSVKDELQSHYNLTAVILPTHKPVIREDLPLRIFRTKEQKDNAIVKAIVEYHAAGRPVLVGSLSVKRCEEICSLLYAEGLKYNELSAKSLEKEAQYVSHAGKGNVITVSTSIAGRGTDIKLSENARLNGGLAVIGTDLFDSSRVDRQLVGRAGRQGDPGSSVFFSSLEDIIIQNLTIDERNQLDELIKSVDSAEIGTPEICAYFIAAQRNREDYFCDLRTKIANKDDLIAPQRKIFYEQRNKVLTQPSIVESIVEDIFVDTYAQTLLDEKLSQLQSKVYILLNRIRKNNKREVQVGIPFSDDKDLFVVNANVNKSLEQNDYFKEEYLRQIILQIYDRYWTCFVSFMQSELEFDEVQRLPYTFEKVKQEMNDVIKSRILNSTIPVSGLDSVTLAPNKDIQHCEKKAIEYKNKKNNRLTKDVLCPCGSGLKYCECHGKDIRNIKRRR